MTAPLTKTIYLGRAEIETTELGLAAFEGQSEVEVALKSGINWSEEGTYPLHGAIYGARTELAKRMLGAGSPITDETYAAAFYHDKLLVSHLPPRPDLLEALEAKERQHHFNWALIHEDLEKARSLGAAGVPINEPILLTWGFGMLAPIHYAVLKGNIELVRLVVDLGANINTLNPEGKSPLRLIAENTLLSARQRRTVITFLSSHGGRFVPEIASRWDRWWALHGSLVTKAP